MLMIYFYRSFAGIGPQTSPGSVKADAVPELSPAERRGEALALGLCVSMKVQIFFSTQTLPNLQQSSLLQQLQLTTDKKKRLQDILRCFV